MPFYRSLIDQSVVGPYDKSYFARVEYYGEIVRYSNVSMSNCFEQGPSSAISLNQNTRIIVGENVTTCPYALAQTSVIEGRQYFNNSVIFKGENIYNLAGFLYNSPNFNQPLTIPVYRYKDYYGRDTVGGPICSNLLNSAKEFNSPIDFNLSYNVSDALAYCTNFNSPIYFSPLNNGYSSDVSMNNFLRGCVNFNQAIAMPRHPNTNKTTGSRGYYDNMFCDCLKYNQVTRLYGENCFGNNVFANCQSFGSDVYIDARYSANTYVYNMFYNCNNQKRKNVYFHNNISAKMKSNGTQNSIVGAEITWTDMTNGFYNAVYNIYCYNNYNFFNILS